MHPLSGKIVTKGLQPALRLAGVIIIGMMLLAACAAPSGASPTATGAVPATGATSTVSAAGTPTGAATTAATSAATAATTGTAAATGAATGAATMASTGTAAATGAATMATTGTPAATGAASGTGTPSAAATAPSSLALTVKTSSSLGKYLADDKGMTLYIFKKDTDGKSVCNGPCAAIWPPLLVAKGGQVTLTGGGDSTKLGTTTRDDGSTQVTYNNQPVYYFAKDKAPGDTTGQGVGGVWFIAQP